MSEKLKSLTAFFGLLFALFGLLHFANTKLEASEYSIEAQMPVLYERLAPTPPSFAYEYSPYRTAPLEVAKVFGRNQGCSDANADFITEVGRVAVYNSVDPRIVAATIAVESGCNAFAVSNRGAVGIMQIHISTWKNKYDFGGRVNLLNEHDNVRVGTEILAHLIQEYGVSEGLHRYNGLGEGGDPVYAAKILNLAGRK